MTENMTPDPAPGEDIPNCPHCGKPPALCVCEAIEPIDNRVELLVLQHPQEQDRLLGSAFVATRSLARAQVKIGLSWPSLSKILGRDVDVSRWGILFLGSASDLPREGEIFALDKKGAVAPDSDRALAGLQGIVIFDGSWAQAKTLWWRNPWVLKARRLALNPPRRSLYGALRREPRREALSTIEAAGFCLARIEQRPEIEEHLRQNFGLMLDKYRAAVENGAISAPAAKPGAGRRGGPRRRAPKKS